MSWSAWTMSEPKRAELQPAEPPADVFDRAHLRHYTMNIAELEAEIVGLFLSQLPITLKMLDDAEVQADWKLAAHTLKGAAASIGAPRIHALAVKAEAWAIGDDAAHRKLLLAEIAEAAGEFRRAVLPLYP